MSTELISVLHATLGRPKKAIAAMMLFHNRTKHPENVEYIFSVNHDDDTRHELKDMLAMEARHLRFAKYFIVISNPLGSAEAWNAAAQACAGELLIQGQDDIEPPMDWDEALNSEIILHCGSRLFFENPFFIAVGDGYRKDALCCTAIMSRAYMAMEGHFLYPGYLSVFSDDEVTYRALRNARDGKSLFIKTDLVFLHRHHYHAKEVPWDDTYAKENSAVAYRIGEKLFRDRNPRAATDGLKTW